MAYSTPFMRQQLHVPRSHLHFLPGLSLNIAALHALHFDATPCVYLIHWGLKAYTRTSRNKS